MMEEYALKDLDMLGERIIETSRQGMADAINELPKGWNAEMDRRLRADRSATLTVGDGEIWSILRAAGVSGSAPLLYGGLYLVRGQMRGGRRHPDHAGTLDAIQVIAREHHRQCVAPRGRRPSERPYAPDVVFGCLHQALPDVVNQGRRTFGTVGRPRHDRPRNEIVVHDDEFSQRGTGARPHQDGLQRHLISGNVPVEITEAITPLVVWQKTIARTRADRSPAGGLGQTMVVANREDGPFGLAAFERVHFPRGRDGGGEGAKGDLHLGRRPAKQGFQPIPKGERLIVEMPGGGGGDRTRDPEAVVRVRAGFIDVQRRRVNTALSSEKGSMSIRPGRTAAGELIVVSLAKLWICRRMTRSAAGWWTVVRGSGAAVQREAVACSGDRLGWFDQAEARKCSAPANRVQALF